MEQIDRKGKPTVAVVTPDDGMFDLIRMVLKGDLGAFVVRARDRGHLVRMLRFVRVNLVLVDIVREVGDDVAAIRRLKRSVSTKDIPVLALTFTREDGDEAIGCGATSYILKPFAVDTLVTIVRQCLSG